MPTAHRSTAGPGRALVVLGVAVLLGATAGCTGGGDPGSAATPHASGTASAQPDADATSAPDGTTGADGTDTDTDQGGPAGAGTGQVDESSSEILPSQAPSPTALPLPELAQTLIGPLPATDTAHGQVVDGFPTDAVPLPDGLTVVSSSVSASGDRLQVGLLASSDGSPADVQAAFAATLGGAGFAVSDSPALPGSAATAFTHGSDGLVLTVRERTGGGTELSLAGTLSTAG